MMKFRPSLHDSQRYRRYRQWFFVFFFVFLLSGAGQFFLVGSDSWRAIPCETEFLSFLQPVLTVEMILILLTFLFGVTLYSPVLSFLIAAFRGVVSGFVLSGLFPLDQGKKVVLFLLSFLYLVGSSWLFCGYSAFCTAVSTRLYTEGILHVPKAEERRMFGGTLFNSVLFCNTVNFRFLFTYCLIFFAMLFIFFCYCALYAFFRSLI